MRLYLIRGLPGAGKTTLAQMLTPAVCENDDFFAGGAHDHSQIDMARAQCFACTVQLMAARVTPLAVSNTFTRLAEMQPYRDLAAAHGYSVTVLTVDSGLTDAELAARNVQGCPEAVVAAWRAKWEA